MIELSPKFLIIAGIVFLVIFITKAIKNEKELNNYKKKEREERQQYYRHKEYKAKDSSFYLMNDKQKLEYTYDNLPPREKKKVLEYAESLQRIIENEKYEPKK